MATRAPYGKLSTMYLAVDIGGTKTLVAVFDKTGVLSEQLKFATPIDYDDFITVLAANVASLTTKSFEVVCMAIPGLINRETGVVHSLGNLPWMDKPIRSDVSNALNGAKVLIENDSKLAGLAAAQPLKDTFENILYVTVSTGINGGLIANGKIVEADQDMEIGKIPLEFEGSIQKWEDFASGRAIVATYGKRASDIDDPKIWHEIGLKIGYGLAIVSSTIQPDVIVFGGGAGKYAEKFIPTIQEYMNTNLHPNSKHPKLLIAKNPEEVVIYGCYEFARQHYAQEPTV